jgi:hypothetical protein
MAEGQGCTIYEDRPKLCQQFECVWLIDPTVPDALKPSESNLIIMPGPEAHAVIVHGRGVSDAHQEMYDEWLANRPASPT